MASHVSETWPVSDQDWAAYEAVTRNSVPDTSTAATSAGQDNGLAAHGLPVSGASGAPPVSPTSAVASAAAFAFLADLHPASSLTLRNNDTPTVMSSSNGSHDGLAIMNAGGARHADISMAEKLARARQWLAQHVEVADKTVVKRGVVYQQYREYAAAHGESPLSTSCFGKTLKQAFPEIRTRRLGTRNDSKYYYYGVRLLGAGADHHNLAAPAPYRRRAAWERESDGSGKQRQAKPERLAMTSLPAMPSSQLPSPSETGIPRDVAAAMLRGYQQHCQQLVDTVVSENPDPADVESIIRSYWTRIPPTQAAALDVPQVQQRVSFLTDRMYESIAFHVLANPAPKRSTEALSRMQAIAESWQQWIRSAVTAVSRPPVLEMAATAARGFQTRLKQRIALYHLCQTVRMMLAEPEVQSSALADIMASDFALIARRVVETCGSCYTSIDQKILGEVQAFLCAERRFDAFVQVIINQISQHLSSLDSRGGRRFLLVWTLYSQLLIRDMTLRHCATLGTMHMLATMLSDLVIGLCEMHRRDREASADIGSPRATISLSNSVLHQVNASAADADTDAVLPVLQQPVMTMTPAPAPSSAHDAPTAEPAVSSAGATVPTSTSRVVSMTPTASPHRPAGQHKRRRDDERRATQPILDNKHVDLPIDAGCSEQNQIGEIRMPLARRAHPVYALQDAAQRTDLGAGDVEDGDEDFQAGDSASSIDDTESCSAARVCKRVRRHDNRKRLPVQQDGQLPQTWSSSTPSPPPANAEAGGTPGKVPETPNVWV